MEKVLQVGNGCSGGIIFKILPEEEGRQKYLIAARIDANSRSKIDLPGAQKTLESISNSAVRFFLPTTEMCLRILEAKNLGILDGFCEYDNQEDAYYLTSTPAEKKDHIVVVSTPPPKAVA